jgi:carboxyl-terminal processing protease
MFMKRFRRSSVLPWAMGLVVLVLALGGGALAANKGQNLYGKLRTFNEILTLIHNNYVEEPDSDHLVESAIQGMLEGLDPHSSYIDAERYEKMQERNEGEYFGIGISFDIRDGFITVISPIEGSPSDRLGIRAGDRIVKINGESAKGISTEEVYDKLRGPKGSIVHIAIQRAGVEEPIEYDIIRDKIPIYSVPYHFMVRPGVGYIRAIRFSKTTSDELETALQNLERQGMQKLILDLRGNTGGFLNQAVEISDMFLPGTKKMIVYTKGRIPGSSEEYYSTGTTPHTPVPLIVLVNHGSASASEIVAGAIQDWDRGLVVGQTTFGKGLVQRQYRMQDGSALLLTVARYYTPSGRLIQRDYTDREHYIEQAYDDVDPNAAPDTTTGEKPLYHTDAGRKVFGGGGITPDVTLDIKYELTPLQETLEKGNQFFEFANHYVIEAKMSRGGDFEAFLDDFAAGPIVTDRFRTYLRDRKVEFKNEDYDKDLPYIQRALMREIAGNLWGPNERYRIILDGDEAISRSLALFPEATLMAKNLKS